MHEGCGSRLSFTNETKLSATSEDEAAWLERLQSGQDASSSSPNGGAPTRDFHFICECFFMTLKAVHLGALKCIDEMDMFNRRLHESMREQQDLEAHAARWVPAAALLPLL